jgi:hypothetical protein
VVGKASLQSCNVRIWKVSATIVPVALVRCILLLQTNETRNCDKLNGASDHNVVTQSLMQRHAAPRHELRTTIMIIIIIILI